ncbi:hypothetical protein MGYG_00622 [Nannizzia gypsea CBS 118893]|uniref:Uncharacterized protein n=1 Tax=Arthroderma gypseum (strain ATCC MYA-4604 / CBS 118893) TaxID=535722 RepID=E5R0S6_ARTGP|nr:hypothetical protein MGYG_00622 [Nannizzia gypsea CBS 118893]EFQ97582.1 hypothetical protein MGYG_00622 [Nannizzia gypsea CBS 118893]
MARKLLAKEPKGSASTQIDGSTTRIQQLATTITDQRLANAGVPTKYCKELNRLPSSFGKSEESTETQTSLFRATSRLVVVVAGGMFGTRAELKKALQRWATEIPQEGYIKILNNAVAQVTEIAEQYEILIGMYEVGRDTLSDYFQNTAIYGKRSQRQ